MKVEKRIIQKKKAVEQELKRLLYREDTVLFQAMRHSVFSGGKRFRPLLVLASGECFGLSERLMLPFACALELIHNYSLIHDDLPSMDNDDFRRSKPSCHKAYGEDIALLAGDSLLTMAFEVLSQAPLEGKFLPRKQKVIHEISRMAGSEGMIGGQFMDISASPDKMTEEEYCDLALKKTGSLIIAALKSGALLGNASSSQVKVLEEYGRAVGLAFQIRDDIMDSDEKVKDKGSACPNAVALFGLKKAKEKLKTFVNKALQSLGETRLDSEELRFMALKLLDYKSGDENG